MNFDEFLNQAWTDHATDAAAVARRLPEGITLLEKPEQAAPLARLMVHVAGEHLGEWTRGIEWLGLLRKSPQFRAASDEAMLKRSIAALELGSGARKDVKDLPASDQIIALATAASALSAQKQAARARELFEESLKLASRGLEKADPANRALAITGNNLACALEERTDRSSADTELMILAAQTGRRYWELAGTWREVQIAEYRLAMTFIQAGQPEQAVVHAHLCIMLGESNDSTPYDQFYAYEALARAEKARKGHREFDVALAHAKDCFALLSDEKKAQCEAALGRLSG